MIAARHRCLSSLTFIDDTIVPPVVTGSPLMSACQHVQRPSVTVLRVVREERGGAPATTPLAFAASEMLRHRNMNQRTAEERRQNHESREGYAVTGNGR